MICHMPARRDKQAFDENNIIPKLILEIIRLLLTNDDLQYQILNTTWICCMMNLFSKPSSSFGIQKGIIMCLQLADND